MVPETYDFAPKKEKNQEIILPILVFFSKIHMKQGRQLLVN